MDPDASMWVPGFVLAASDTSPKIFQLSPLPGNIYDIDCFYYAPSANITQGVFAALLAFAADHGHPITVHDCPDLTFSSCHPSAVLCPFPEVPPTAEAQEEANQLNVINQLVIGAKEGVVKAITKLVGSDVTNAILQAADGSDHKSTNNFTLFKVMKLAIYGAGQPSTNNVLEQLLEVINHNFYFCKKASVNMELMQSNAA